MSLTGLVCEDVDTLWAEDNKLLLSGILVLLNNVLVVKECPTTTVMSDFLI